MVFDELIADLRKCSSVKEEHSVILKALHYARSQKILNETEYRTACNMWACGAHVSAMLMLVPDHYDLKISTSKFGKSTCQAMEAIGPGRAEAPCHSLSLAAAIALSALQIGSAYVEIIDE